MTDDALPPMPPPAYTVPMGGYLYTADQMRSYAAQAADAERERCAQACRDFGATLEVDVGDCFAEAVIAGPNVGIEPPYSVGSNDGLGPF